MKFLMIYKDIMTHNRKSLFNNQKNKKNKKDKNAGFIYWKAPRLYYETSSIQIANKWLTLYI